MSQRDDEVQREMTRYCAGLDHWDEMPVVVEGWLRVFEGLQEQRDEMLAALKLAQPEFCSIRCPSVFRGPDSARHIRECVAMQDLIAKPEIA